MYTFSASAPGKLFLSGEYAVLDGAKAVISSVGRRVTASTTRQNLPQSQLLVSVRDEAARFLCERAGAKVGQLPNIEIDSSGFSSNRIKLGIGSSAAVSAAAAGVFFLWAGLEIEEFLQDILQVATVAHRNYQGGKGSGADVATSVLGGTVIFQKDEKPVVAESCELERVFVWTGKSASTISLVDEIRKLQRENDSAYRNAMDPLVELANELASCYQQGNVEKTVELTAKYGGAMEVLGNAAGVSIITEELNRVANIARQCGGAAKPSGAGGGDAAVAVFLKSSDANEFRKQCGENGIMVLDFETHVNGLMGK